MNFGNNISNPFRSIHSNKSRRILTFKPTLKFIDEDLIVFVECDDCPAKTS